MAASDRFRTHEVENQVPALGAYNAFLADTALREAVAREGGGWAETELTRIGIDLKGAVERMREQVQNVE